MSLHIYKITTNASSGDGSFVAKYAAATSGQNSGDTYVICPDTSVFQSSSTVVSIIITEKIDSAGAVIIDGSLRRIRFVGATGVGQFFVNSDTTKFINCDFINFNNASSINFNNASSGEPVVYSYSSSLEFDNCVFAGNSNNSAILSVGGTLVVKNCAIYGNGFASPAIVVMGQCSATIQGSTIVGNTSGDVISYDDHRGIFGSATAVTLNQCICNSIVDDPTTPVITTTNCAIGNSSTMGFVSAPPNSYTTFDKDDWASWNIHLTPNSDYADAATSSLGFDDCEGTRRYASGGSIGAYETINADYYYHAEPVAANSGWSLTRFGTINANLNPSNGSTCFIEGQGSVDFDDVEDITLIVAGYTEIEIDNVTIKYVPNDLFPYECTIVQGTNAYRDFRHYMLQGSFSRGNNNELGFQGGYDATYGGLVVNVYDSDDDYSESFGYYHETVESYGEYLWYDNVTHVDAAIVDPSITSQRFLIAYWYTTVEPSCKLIVKGPMETDGLSIYGDVEIQENGCISIVTGNTRVYEGGSVRIEGGRLYLGGALTMNGGSIDFVGNHNTSVLAMADSTVLGAIEPENFLADSTRGYLVVDDATDASTIYGLNLSEDVIVCSYNANISDFSTGDSDEDGNPELSWTDGRTSLQGARTVCIEYRAASDTDYTLLDATCSSTPNSDNEIEVELEQSQEDRIFRLFDGVYFHEATAESTYIAVDSEYREEIVESLDGTTTLDPTKNLIVLAQLKSYGQYITVSDISSIRLTVAKKGNDEQYASVDNYTNTVVDNDCVITLTKTDAWTKDANGFNFVWVSDVPGYGEVGKPDYLSVAGDYKLQFTFNFTGNRESQTMSIPFTVPE